MQTRSRTRSEEKSIASDGNGLEFAHGNDRRSPRASKAGRMYHANPALKRLIKPPTCGVRRQTSAIWARQSVLRYTGDGHI